MDEKITLASFVNDAPVITLSVAEQDIKIRTFFSLSCCRKMFEHYTQENSYRSAFVKTVHYMYQKTDGSNNHLVTEQDFANITDENLYFIINTIIEQDNKLKTEYNTVAADDVYERFFLANEGLLRNIAVDVSKSFAKIRKSVELQSKALSLSFGNLLGNLGALGGSLTEMKTALAKLPKFDFPEPASQLVDISIIPSLQSVVANIPEMQFPKLTSIISNIPQPIFDTQMLITPLKSFNESIQHINSDLAETLRTSLSHMMETVKSWVDSIDFSLILHSKEWNEQRDTLLKYEWFYSNEISNDLVKYIHENQGKLSIDDVDKLIVDDFRQNRCKALKTIIKSWNELPFFRCRSGIFHEALVNHSRRYFNSSVTLLTIHTEGIITDFVRVSLENPCFKVKTAIADIKNAIDENDTLSIYQHEVFHDVIGILEIVFNESFIHSNPDATSNKSRHKIAHGHAYEPESEVNSLKKFLYINELYYLFSLLHESR